MVHELKILPVYFRSILRGDNLTEKLTRQERIAKLQRAIELGYKYEKTYIEEMEMRKEIRQKQEDKVNRLLEMTYEEYEKESI